YLARSIPNAEMIYLKRVSHFAPLQRPAEFNAAAVSFLDGVAIPAKVRGGLASGIAPK
ncbi:alpha/beta fold hydrolase, partial [Rhizobium ruizarguesonis]